MAKKILLSHDDSWKGSYDRNWDYNNQQSISQGQESLKIDKDTQDMINFAKQHQLQHDYAVRGALGVGTADENDKYKKEYVRPDIEKMKNPKTGEITDDALGKLADKSIGGKINWDAFNQAMGNQNANSTQSQTSGATQTSQPIQNTDVKKKMLLYSPNPRFNLINWDNK